MEEVKASVDYFGLFDENSKSDEDDAHNWGIEWVSTPPHQVKEQ